MRRPPKRTDLNGDEPRPGTKPYWTQANIDYLYGKQRGYCAECRNHYRSKDMQIDHVTPRSKGGGNELANLQLLCAHCNSVKGDGTMDDLRARRDARGAEWR